MPVPVSRLLTSLGEAAEDSHLSGHENGKEPRSVSESPLAPTKDTVFAQYLFCPARRSALENLDLAEEHQGDPRTRTHTQPPTTSQSRKHSLGCGSRITRRPRRSRRPCLIFSFAALFVKAVTPDVERTRTPPLPAATSHARGIHKKIRAREPLNR